MALSRIIVPKRLTVESNVITTGLLVQSIEDERRWVEEERRETESDLAGERIEWPAIELRVADKLVLSYSRIKQIDNLGGLTSLLKLRLDNNAIERISGLDTLTQLRELDLSFNLITEIAGLGTLSKLTDLSLHSNRIGRIAGLDAQVHSLESLSLGRNLVTEPRAILYLRRFANLRVLCLEDNFKTSGAEYRSSTLAVLPRLRYLDWSLVTDSERKSAVETHHRLLAELQEAAIAAGEPALASGGGGPGHHDPVHKALGGGADAAASSTSADVAGGATADWIVQWEANLATGAAAVREAGVQFVAYCWRIMQDPQSVADIAGLGQGAGATANAARKAAAAAASSGASSPQGGGGGGGPPGDHTMLLPGAADNDAAVCRVPGVRERLEALQESVTTLAEQTVTRGMAAHADIAREIAAAAFVCESYLEASDALAKRLLQDHTAARKHRLQQARNEAAAGHRHGDRSGGEHDSAAAGAGAGPGGDADAADGGASTSDNSEVAAAEATIRAMAAQLEDNEALHARLLGIETVLHEQCGAVLAELDAAYAESAAKRADLFSKFFRAVEKEALAAADESKGVALAAVDAFQEHAALLAAAGGGVAALGGGGPGPAAVTTIAGSTGGPGAGDAAGGAATGSGAAVGSGDASVSGQQRRPHYDEEVAALLSDRESALVAVSNSFDQKIARVLAAEDKTRTGERERERALVKAQVATEAARHRHRMAEVEATYLRNRADAQAVMAAEQHTLAELLGE